MAALELFSQQIEARLAAARREPRWQAAETTQFMAELELRRRPRLLNLGKSGGCNSPNGPHFPTKTAIH